MAAHPNGGGLPGRCQLHTNHRVRHRIAGAVDQIGRETMFTIKPRGGGYVVLLTATNQPFGTYATERGAKIRVAELERKFGKKPQ